MPLLETAMILYENAAKGLTPTASTEDSAHPASRLGKHLLSEKWRGEAGELSGETLTTDLGETVAIDGVVLLGTNFTLATTRLFELDDADDFADPLDDSGSGAAFDTSYGTPKSVIRAGGRHVIWLPDSTVSCRYGRATITDAANPDDYLEASVFGLWKGWQPVKNFDASWSYPSRWPGERGSRGRLKTHEFTFRHLTATEEAAINSIADSVQDTGRLVVIPRPAKTEGYLAEAIFCVLERPPEVVVNGAKDEWRSVTVSVIEVDE